MVENIRNASINGACMVCLILVTVNILFYKFQKVKIMKSSGTTIIRSIAANGAGCLASTNDCHRISTDGNTQYTCCCTSDLCNSVSTVRQQRFIVFTIMSLVMYRWF